jgi:predicted nucleic acid-binding protein
VSIVVVSNASPLINLARIGKLDLLRQLYEELSVPEAVWQEIVVTCPRTGIVFAAIA